MISFYYSFGEYDGVLISESSDDKAAAAIILTAIMPGHIKDIKTTTLLTVEDTLDSLRKAGEMTFRAPGG